MANSLDPDQTPCSALFAKAFLIWVYTVCKGLSIPILRVITVIFIVIDHEMISVVILCFPLIKEGQLLVTGKVWLGIVTALSMTLLG